MEREPPARALGDRLLGRFPIALLVDDVVIIFLRFLRRAPAQKMTAGIDADRAVVGDLAQSPRPRLRASPHRR